MHGKKRGKWYPKYALSGKASVTFSFATLAASYTLFRLFPVSGKSLGTERRMLLAPYLLRCIHSVPMIFFPFQILSTDGSTKSGAEKRWKWRRPKWSLSSASHKNAWFSSASRKNAWFSSASCKNASFSRFRARMRGLFQALKNWLSLWSAKIAKGKRWSLALGKVPPPFSVFSPFSPNRKMVQEALLSLDPCCGQCWSKDRV